MRAEKVLAIFRFFFRPETAKYPPTKEKFGTAEGTFGLQQKILQHPISTVIVDVHVYKIFRITDFIAALLFVILLSAVQKIEI